jgi:uncharacterized protein DUF6460
MLESLLRTLVKIAVASLIVGTILNHFGITIDKVMKEFGLSPDRMAELARQTIEWALPNMLLGSLIILPVWFLVYLFRPPGQSSE